MGFSSSAQSDKCLELKKQRFVLEEKGADALYRLMDCGLDSVDVAIMRVTIGQMLINEHVDLDKLTYKEVIGVYEQLKVHPEYPVFRKTIIEEEVKRRNTPLAQPKQVDYSGLCGMPKDAAEYRDGDYLQAHYYHYNEALACARKQGKVLMVYFTGRSCINCRHLEKKILADPEIRKILEAHVIIVTLYCDDKDHGAEHLKMEEERFGEVGQPLVVFLDNKERILDRKLGYGNKEDFLKNLKEVIR